MKTYGKSDIGLVRDENQDNFSVFKNQNNDLLAIVCDGIGGGNAGGVASKIAVDYLVEKFKIAKKLNSDMEVKRWLLRVILEANDEIRNRALTNREFEGMGTTCVGVIYNEVGTYIFNVGDSRVYGLYDDLIPLTEDHSYLSELLRDKSISSEEAYQNPSRNKLTNALGVWKNIKVDVNKIKDDYSLLMVSSDGLHGFVPLNIIRDVLLEKTAINTKADKLVELALEAGGYDNITVVLLEKVGDKDA